MWKKLIKTSRRRAPVDAAAPHMRNLRGGRFVRKFDFWQIQSPVTKDNVGAQLWNLFQIFLHYQWNYSYISFLTSCTTSPQKLGWNKRRKNLGQMTHPACFIIPAAIIDLVSVVQANFSFRLSSFSQLVISVDPTWPEGSIEGEPANVFGCSGRNQYGNFIHLTPREAFVWAGASLKLKLAPACLPLMNCSDGCGLGRGVKRVGWKRSNAR